MARHRCFCVDIVLFDFRKAFDIVRHSVLIDKLRLLGVSGSLLNLLGLLDWSYYESGSVQWLELL